MFLKADLRPPQLLLQRDVPHTSCLCIHHENLCLLHQSLNRAGLECPLEVRAFIYWVVYDQDSQVCMPEMYYV